MKAIHARAAGDRALDDLVAVRPQLTRDFDDGDRVRRRPICCRPSAVRECARPTSQGGTAKIAESGANSSRGEHEIDEQQQREREHHEGLSAARL